MRIASLFLLFGLALAQGFLPAPKTKAPLPPWIKPGLLLAYADDVGLMRAVYLVTDVTADTAVGAYLVVASSPNGMAQAQLNFGALVQNGIGPIYVDQNAAARWAEMAAADPNIEVRATPGYLIVTSGEHQVSLVYDPNTGLVLEHAEVFAQNRGQNPPMPNSIHFRLAGRYQLDWPRAASPPAAAQSPHVYQILTRTIVPGYPPIEQVLGELSVSPAGAMPPLYAFQVNVSGPQMPYTGPNQVYGTATYGPFYLHPALLAREAIFSAPEVGLALVQTGPGEYALTLWNNPIQYLRYDPESGLLLEERDIVPGLGEQVFRLLR